MAKRKRLKNVQISTEELKPTTIGYLSNRQKGPFLLIFIFLVLFATLYYMPQITEYFNKIFNPELYAEMQEAKQPINTDSTGVIEELGSGTQLSISGILFSNFAIKNGELTFSVDTTKASGEFNNYYLETYDRSQHLLERLPLASTSITSVPLVYTNVKFISITQYDENNYPNVNLENSKLSCTNKIDEYEYEFANGGLTKVSYSITAKLTEENAEEYNAELTKYSDAADLALEGIEQYLTSDDTGFTYTKIVDLQVASSTGLDYGFEYNAKANKIAFELSTKGYQCN